MPSKPPPTLDLGETIGTSRAEMLQAPQSPIGGVKKTCNDKAKAGYLDSLPQNLRKLPKVNYGCGAFFIFGSFVAFAMLFWSSYESEKAVEYMSIIEEGKPAPAGCVENPRTISNKFELDTAGYWDRSTRFDDVKALYDFEVKSLATSEANYVHKLAPAVNSMIGSINTKMGKQTSVENLLTLVTNTYKIDGDAMQMAVRVEMNSVFDQDYSAGSFSWDTSLAAEYNATTDGFCTDVFPTYTNATWNTTECTAGTDSNSAYIGIPKNYANLMTAFMDTSRVKSETVDFHFDIRSILVASAVNQGLLPMSELSPLDNMTWWGEPYAVSNYTSTMRQMYLKRHIAMDPIVCDTQTQLCNVLVFKGYMYPFVRHWTQDDCGCDKVYNAYCDVFDVNIGMYFRPDGCFTNKKMGTMAYPEPPPGVGYHGLNINFYGYSTSVNSNHVKFPKSNCNAKLLELKYDKKNAENFGSSVPTELIENYYKCKYTTGQVLINAFSSSYANTMAVQAAFLPFLVAIAIFIVRKWYKINVGQVSQAEIEELQLAMTLEYRERLRTSPEARERLVEASKMAIV